MSHQLPFRNQVLRPVRAELVDPDCLFRGNSANRQFYSKLRFSQPRHAAFPPGLLDRAFYARVQDIPRIFGARFNGLALSGFSRDAKAVDKKHVGSALTFSIFARTQR